MSLEVTETIREGILILALKGRLTAGESNVIREKVDQAIAAGQLNVVFDLSHVDYVDSTGLGGMVICYTTLKKHGGALKLVNPNKRNVELLALTKLAHHLRGVRRSAGRREQLFPRIASIKRFDILVLRAAAGKGSAVEYFHSWLRSLPCGRGSEATY
jgi:anti-sigma B factor antagonist